MLANVQTPPASAALHPLRPLCSIRSRGRCRAGQEGPLHRHRRHAVRRDREGRHAESRCPDARRHPLADVPDPGRALSEERHDQRPRLVEHSHGRLGRQARRARQHVQWPQLRGVPALLRPAEGSAARGQDRLARHLEADSRQDRTSAADVSINYEQKDTRRRSTTTATTRRRPTKR